MKKHTPFDIFCFDYSISIHSCRRGFWSSIIHDDSQEQIWEMPTNRSWTNDDSNFCDSPAGAYAKAQDVLKQLFLNQEPLPQITKEDFALHMADLLRK